MSLRLRKLSNSCVDLHWKHSLSRFLQLMNVTFTTLKPSASLIKLTFPLGSLSFPFQEHFDVHLPFIYDGIFRHTCLIILYQQEEGEAKGGDSMRREEMERSGSGKKNGKATNVLYFYRVHAPSCLVKFLLHVCV